MLQFTTLDSKDIGIIKSEFVAKTLNSFDIKEMYTDRMDNFTRQFGALIFSGRLHIWCPYILR